ncbi:MAG: thiamine pyrophosphate-binding protein [Spirochaetes bacterium]|nr:MAG: thiamine pyrophosphate-binding protein [Spirochaetota bacterium]
MNERMHRAQTIARHKTIERAVESGGLSQFQDLSVSEAIVLGLFRQGVTKYFAVFGHGTTDIAEALRVYEDAGLVKTWNVRHETAAAHAATALRMITGEVSAVITSIGPGAMHAFAGSLCAASNGAGVYHIYGDETTHNEGFNMQQIPRDEQGLFLKMTGVMGCARALYEPWSVVAALRAGAVAVNGEGFNRPCFLLAPMNVQPAILKNFNLLELSGAYVPRRLACADEDAFLEAASLAREARRVTIKIGQGARGCGPEIADLAELLDAAIVAGPSASGIVSSANPRYMTVGGSKGSISGNFAMNEADLVVVVGARAVCQWDSSGTAWKNARAIINFNIEPAHAAHYNRGVPVPGDAKLNLRRWIGVLKSRGFAPADGRSEWSRSILVKRAEWIAFRNARYDCPVLHDEVWGRPVLTQPAAIKAVCDFADAAGALKIFDAGDVQANGFQIVEDHREGMTLTDTGSSYMGFAASALLGVGLAGRYAVAFCGDGSFTMNPQVLIDATAHGTRGCIVLFDNRRMAAIAGLQKAQYGNAYKTADSVEVDYVAWAGSVKGVRALPGGSSIGELKSALEQAFSHNGLSLVHVPVYYGDDERGGMGVFGDWNVGSWCERVQAEHHRIGL